MWRFGVHVLVVIGGRRAGQSMVLFMVRSADWPWKARDCLVCAAATLSADPPNGYRHPVGVELAERAAGKAPSAQILSIQFNRVPGGLSPSRVVWRS